MILLRNLVHNLNLETKFYPMVYIVLFNYIILYVFMIYQHFKILSMITVYKTNDNEISLNCNSTYLIL